MPCAYTKYTIGLFDAAIQRSVFSLRVFEGCRWPQRYERIGDMSVPMLTRLILSKLYSYRARHSPLCSAIHGAIQFTRECDGIELTEDDEDRLRRALAEVAAGTLRFTCVTRNLAGEDELGLGSFPNTRQVALMGAVALGDQRLVQRLIEVGGADVNQQALLFGSPLALSAQLGNLEIFRLLVQQHGARRDGVAKGDDRPTLAWFAARCRPPLETAVRANHQHIIDELFRPLPADAAAAADRGRDSGDKRNSNCTKPPARRGASYDRALRCAVSKDDDAIARSLWENKAPNWRPEEPGLGSVRANQYDWVRRATRDILTAATRRGHSQLVQMMLNDTSVHPTVKEAIDKEVIADVLVTAASVGNAAIAQLVIGKYPPEKYLRKETMRAAAEGGNVTILQALLDHGAEIEACSDEVGQYNELYKSLTRGHADAVRFLLSKGASLERRDCGQEALCWAAAHKEAEIVRLIASFGVKVDLPVDDKLNPVIAAMSYSRHSNVEVLYELGAKPVDPKDSCHNHAYDSGYWPFNSPLEETDHRSALW